MQLTTGMYKDPETAGLFGLKAGQTCSTEDRVTWSSWFNGLGHRLGGGVLSKADFLRISQEINKGEFFITTFGEPSSAQDIGVKAVADYAMYIITQGKIYVIVHDEPHVDQEFERYGLHFHGIACDDVMGILCG